MPRAEVHKLMERMAIPAIAAPMFLVSNPALTLACCGEGLMGSFPAHGTRSREEFQGWLDEMVEGMKRLEDAGKKPAPWAVNLVVHASNPRYQGDLELVEKYKVPVILARCWSRSRPPASATPTTTRSGADPEGLFPAILGHEGAGIVVDVSGRASPR
jgi:NAD(P)H-dependent flavin oxidoreductase YrpB (nitropropane dioxygenase family)